MACYGGASAGMLGEKAQTVCRSRADITAILTVLSIGKFYGGNDGSKGEREPEFTTLSVNFIREHHNNTLTGEKVRFAGLALRSSWLIASEKCLLFGNLSDAEHRLTFLPATRILHMLA